MIYMLFVAFFCLLMGLVMVASNPSPYFGAVGLVLSSAFGCMILVEFGGSFVSLILFLIYLGGMLVVFAYSVALASDPFPEGVWNWSVGIYFFSYMALMFILLAMFIDSISFSSFGLVSGEACGFNIVRSDFMGVSLLYGVGGVGLMVCGWGLLLTLFVVLELTRGVSRASLRVV